MTMLAKAKEKAAETKKRAMEEASRLKESAKKDVAAQKQAGNNSPLHFLSRLID